MRMVALNAALALLAHMPAILQMLTPRDLHLLQARWGTAVFEVVVYKGGSFD